MSLKAGSVSKLHVVSTVWNMSGSWENGNACHCAHVRPV